MAAGITRPRLRLEPPDVDGMSLPVEGVVVGLSGTVSALGGVLAGTVGGGVGLLGGTLLGVTCTPPTSSLSLELTCEGMRFRPETNIIQFKKHVKGHGTLKTYV